MLTPIVFAMSNGFMDMGNPEVYAVTNEKGEEFARIRRSSRKGRYVWRLGAPLADRKAVYESPEEAMAAFQQLRQQQSIAALIGR